MIHNREDYQDRIFDSLPPTEGGIPEDCPVFLLKGGDMVAADVVRYWAMRAAKAGAAPEMVQQALLQADAMEQWRPKKVPDVPDVPEALIEARRI